MDGEGREEGGKEMVEGDISHPLCLFLLLAFTALLPSSAPGRGRNVKNV